MFNKVVKSSLRKAMTEFPGAFWDNLLVDIVMGIRTAVSSSHGYSPFEVLYKQPIIVPGTEPVPMGACPLVSD